MITLHDLVDLLEKVGGWLNSRTQPLTPPLNFGSLNTVVDRRSDEQGVGGIMAQIEQRIRRGLMAFGTLSLSKHLWRRRGERTFFVSNGCTYLF